MKIIVIVSYEVEADNEAQAESVVQAVLDNSANEDVSGDIISVERA